MNLVERINCSVDDLQGELVTLLQELVRIPSTNHPPGGDERAVQVFYANTLRKIGLETDLFEPEEVPGFTSHPGRLETHDMAGRPCVAGVWKGTGSGRSLILIAHADTEQTGDPALWTSGDPFNGVLRNGRVYGRGAGDDKSGMAINAMVVYALRKAGLRLKGDLTVASVPDEEKAGGNGSVALLLKGYTAQAGIFMDGVNMELSTSGLGAGSCLLDISVPGPAMDAEALLAQVDRLRLKIGQLREQRALDFSSNPYYREYFATHPAVILTQLSLAVDDNTHGTLLLWFFLLPGEQSGELQDRVEAFLGSDLGYSAPAVLKFCWTPRFLLPALVPENHPFVACLSRAYQAACGRPAIMSGSLASDMGLINRYGGFPCLVFGPVRWGVEGMAHQPDEYVEVADLVVALRTALYAATDWCGVEEV